MAKRKVKGKAKKKNGWLKGLLFCFVAYFVVVMIVQQIQLDSQKAEVSQLEDKRNDIERDNKEMTEQKEFTNTPEYLEYLMRLKLGWVKPDEKKYIGD